MFGFGGSPIGNSRVKLTNVADCVKRRTGGRGQDPLKVADQLTADGVDVLHTIGGDDTNTTAADLAAYLHENSYELTVVGLPKTIDNDIFPIKQSWVPGPRPSRGRSSRRTSSPSIPPDPALIVHEVMGRGCQLPHPPKRRRPIGGG